MPFNLDIVGACENIRKEAETMAGENYAYNLKRKTGALDFMTSPENGGVDASLISYDEGRKIASLKILYDQRTKPCQISTNCDQNVCDEGATPLRKQAIIDISGCLKTPVRRYSNDDMVALCKDTPGFMRGRGVNDIVAAHQKLSELLLAEMGGQIGVNHEFDGTETAALAYKNVALTVTSSGQKVPLPGNFSEVLLDYETNQLNGTPAIVGQGIIQQFYKLHGWSCCNATTPYGEANMDSEARFYLDQAANSVLGDNKFILAAFKILHLLTFNENRNIMITDEAQVHTVIPDPLGYPFDWNLDFYFDKCDKVWKSMYSLTWGVFNTYQADSFAGAGDDSSPDVSPDCDDDLEGMTGVFGYTATTS
jgi:hypothetical protein